MKKKENRENDMWPLFTAVMPCVKLIPPLPHSFPHAIQGKKETEIDRKAVKKRRKNPQEVRVLQRGDEDKNQRGPT